MKMGQHTELEQHQVLEYDQRAECALRREFYGHPPIAYRDPALLEAIGDGCFHTKPVDRAGHGW